MNNTRFATNIHILTLLAKFPDEWLSSDFISKSIQINAVMVRKELSLLQNIGWISTKKGKEGGSKLQAKSEEITLADLYIAIKSSNVLGKKNECEGSDCPIGEQINQELEKLFQETDEAVIQSLKSKNLKDFVEQFNHA